MKLHFRALGSGPPLVILHGLLGSLDNWVTVAQKLATHFQVFLLDLRNHGQSPHADAFAYEDLVGDVQQFLSEHRIPATHLLGHSMGGKVAMRFAQLHEAVLNRLVVVDMSPREYPPQFDALLDAMHALRLTDFQRRDEVEQALAADVTDQRVRQFLLKNLGRGATGRLYWKPNLGVIRAHYGAVRSRLPVVKAVARPTLFIRGGESDYVCDTDRQLIGEMFTNVSLEMIPGVGHWVHADAPEEFVGLVRDFLLRET